MSDFASQEKQVHNIVQEKPGIYAIVKPTRVGASLNLTGTPIQTKQRIVVVTHSNDLAREIKRQIPKILGYKPKIFDIPDNVRLCRMLDPSLPLKFQLKKSCRTCRYNGKPQYCLYQRLLMEDADLYLLTYDKLEILQATTSRLLTLTDNCKFVILDACMHAAVTLHSYIV